MAEVTELTALVHHDHRRNRSSRISRTASVLFRDNPRDMTLSRRIAMRLSQFEWYNPQIKAKREYNARAAEAGDGGEGGAEPLAPPSLAGAWSYFEHISLPRHYLRKAEGKDVNKRAKAGEDREPTRLYDVCGTREDDLADFGIGMALYFFTLRSLAVILFLAGCINIPIILYYSSDWYNHNKEGRVETILRGSAICTDVHFVACPTCSKSQWDYFPRTFDRYAESVDGTLKFIKVNNCPVYKGVGWLSFFSLLFVFVSICVLCYFVKKREVRFDEATQTTQDYSLQVENPPKDARDASEWRDFFSQFGEVRSCTVVLHSEELTRALVERRQLLIQLFLLRRRGTMFDKFNLDSAVENTMPLKPWQKLIHTDASSLRQQILNLDEKITEYSSTPYDASEVFVIFETEQEQRAALTALSLRRWDRWTKKDAGLPKNLLFRGGHVLKTREPPEPSSVLWKDLDKTFSARVFRRMITSAVTFVMIVCGCILIRFCRDRYGPAVGALSISALNTAAPYACQFITDFEYHRSYGSKQTSRYMKITASLWVFTALITSIVTPFTDTVSNDSDGVIRSLYAIYIFELLRGPVTQALDCQGHFNRHIRGPRAIDQDSMNLLFQGAAYELGARYTNMTNVLFMTFYYATIFPAGFFFAAGTLVVHYWTDKFCLLRSWAQAPRLGIRISAICRTYIVVTIVAFAFISSYYVASFPFDNVCDDSTTVSSNYIGNWTIRVGDGSADVAEIAEDDKNHFFCSQDMLRYKPFPAFPPVASKQPEGGEWMSGDQEAVSNLYGLTSAIVLAVVVAILLSGLFFRAYQFLFTTRYKPSGRPGKERFSDVNEIYGYVPQIRVEGLPFPFLICDISGINPGLIGWRDSYHGNDSHNVIQDIPGLIEMEDRFSVVKDWAAPNKKT